MKKTPEQQFSVKTLDKVFNQLKSEECPNGIPGDKVLGKEGIGSYQRRGMSDSREVYRRRSEKSLVGMDQRTVGQMMDDL